MPSWPAIALIACFLLPSPAQASSADQQFEALYAREWTWRQQQFGGQDDEEEAADAGNDHLPAVDAASQRQRLAYWDEVLRELDAIAPKDLSADNRINLAVYRPQVENLAAEVRFRSYEMPFNSDSQFWSDLGFMTRRPLDSAQAARNYIAKLDDVPRYFDEHIVNMRAGLARGYSVPRVSVLGRDRTIEPYVTADASNPLYAPFAQEIPLGFLTYDPSAVSVRFAGAA